MIAKRYCISMKAGSTSGPVNSQVWFWSMMDETKALEAERHAHALAVKAALVGVGKPLECSYGGLSCQLEQGVDPSEPTELNPDGGYAELPGSFDNWRILLGSSDAKDVTCSIRLPWVVEGTTNSALETAFQALMDNGDLVTREGRALDVFIRGVVTDRRV